jgi:hypothetical protein
MTDLEVLVPIAPTRRRAGILAPRLTTFDGRIALLDNLKANAGELLRLVAGAMPAALSGFTLATFTKNATAAAPDAVMAHLKQCDAVILAIAD